MLLRSILFLTLKRLPVAAAILREDAVQARPCETEGGWRILVEVAFAQRFECSASCSLQRS